MLINSRNVLTTRSAEDVLRILNNSSSYHGPLKVNDDRFYLKIKDCRYGRVGYVPVRGYIKKAVGSNTVRLEIHGGVSFYIGMLILIVGLVHLLYNLAIIKNADYSAVSCLIFSVVIYLQTLFDSTTYLDNFEHKLRVQEGG